MRRKSVLLGVLLGVAVSSPAGAATYDVTTCAPGSASSGWTTTVTSANAGAEDVCSTPDPGGLWAGKVGGPVTVQRSAMAQLIFTAPANTTIAGVDIQRYAGVIGQPPSWGVDYWATRDDLRRSYDQMLWTGVKKRAAYLPG